jgi:hypothetical protein
VPISTPALTSTRGDDRLGDHAANRDSHPNLNAARDRQQSLQHVRSSCRRRRRRAEERDRIEQAGLGQGLLVTTGRRVWVNLYGHTSPGEYAMANTDLPQAGRDLGRLARFHCATPMVSMHIASGMYGLIVVEPPGGLPRIDYKFYVSRATSTRKALRQFDMAEQPDYVVFNGPCARSRATMPSERMWANGCASCSG